MILRPESDADLIALIGDVLIDVRLQGDTRALVAGLLIRRDLDCFPLVANLGAAARMSIGVERARRMLNEMRAAGYLVRAFWKVPYIGRAPAYSSICGEPAAIVAAIARFGVGLRPSIARGQHG